MTCFLFAIIAAVWVVMILIRDDEQAKEWAEVIRKVTEVKK